MRAGGRPPKKSLSESLVPRRLALGYPADLLESATARDLSPAQKQAALDRLANFGDPARFSSLNLDCGSCHLNTNARGYFEQQLTLTARQSFAQPSGQNTMRIDQTELAGNVLIAFGYFGDRVAVSQRAINESARVADWFARGAL